MSGELTNAKVSVALSSVFASIFLTIIKLAVGLATGSLGILSEAAHSALDCGAALITWFAVRVSDLPADEKHPYGHTKMESVAALIETGLLMLTSAWIIYESAERLFFRKVQVHTTWYAVAVVLVSMAVDLSRSRALKKVAEETGSQALEADALHFSSDILSSAAVLAGLGLVWLGVSWGDTAAALGVAMVVAHAGWQLGRRTIDVLVDAAPAGLSDGIEAAALATKGVLGVDRLRVRPLGPNVFIDIAIAVNRNLSLESAGAIRAALLQSIGEAAPGSDIAVETRAVQPDNETLLERVQALAAAQGLSVHNVAIHRHAGGRSLSLDLEVNSRLTMRDAHEIASAFEAEVAQEIGEEMEIITHIEPMNEVVESENAIDIAACRAAEETIRGLSTEMGGVCRIDNVGISQSRGQLLITLDCLVEGDTPLADAHAAVTTLEHLVRRRIPQARRVVVHCEPLPGT